MLAEGQGAIDYAPHLLIVPLACVVLIVFGFVLIGESLVAPRRRLAPEVMARYLIVRAGLGLDHDRRRRPAHVRAPVLAPGRPRPPHRGPAGVAGGARDRARQPAPRRLGRRRSSSPTSTDVAQGDLGVSYIRRRPVIDLIMERLPATAVLAAGGLVVEVILGGGLGLWDGLRRKRSRGLAAANVVLLSIPTYSLGLPAAGRLRLPARPAPAGRRDERRGADPARR